MSLIGDDFKCYDCETVTYKLHKRSERPDSIECPECGGETYRMITASIARVSSPEGSPEAKRFRGLKEARKYQRQLQKAKAAGDRDLVSEIKSEQKKIKAGVKSGVGYAKTPEAKDT